MCEANVYMEINGVEELVMESVDVLEPEENDTWRLVGIFGDQKLIRGRLKAMKLVDHRIVFTS
jgi:predicted RNA-binding protein